MKKENDFLLEIHTEELPPKSLLKLSRALTEAVKSGLKNAGLTFGKVEDFATPRRLAVVVHQLIAKQPVQIIERKGPSVKAAYDANGNPTKAAEGFARSCGIDVAQLETIKEKKGEFLYFKTSEPGKTVFELLPTIVENAIKALPIPKLMRWSDNAVAFVRPVHSVILLYGKKKIAAEFFGKETTQKTKGHRFHSKKAIKIKSPKEYAKKLHKKGFVVGDFETRQSMIEAEIRRVAAKHQAEPFIEADLLEEVTALVEWPIVLVGRFPEKYLKLPQEVLISSMQDHQRCFPLLDKQRKLLPLFVIVSNLESVNETLVVKGNERVMNARLADAEFFYHADRMRPLESYREDLKNVVFQASLGTLYDKTARVAKLAAMISAKCGFDEKLAVRAAELSKCDLMTSMVGEFPELQGIMGSYYAEHDGEPEEVVEAMTEQYMPVNAEASLPKGHAGFSVALADRIDTLIGIFGIGKIPTGDKDPFALRRAALGVIRLAEYLSVPKLRAFDIQFLLEESQELYGDLLKNSLVVEEVWEFILERLKYWLLSQGYSANHFAAVRAIGEKDFREFRLRLDAVKHFSNLPEAESLAAANKRVHNILVKENIVRPLGEVDREKLVEKAERALADLVAYEENREQGNYKDQLHSLAKLKGPIDQFFDEVMVMCEDEVIRKNRLALLAKLRDLFLRVADISLL